MKKYPLKSTIGRPVSSPENGYSVVIQLRTKVGYLRAFDKAAKEENFENRSDWIRHTLFKAVGSCPNPLPGDSSRLRNADLRFRILPSQDQLFRQEAERCGIKYSTWAKAVLYSNVTL